MSPHLDDETASRILGKAIGFVLPENYGVAVEIDDEWYMVYRSGELVHLSYLDDKRDAVNDKEIEDGQVVFVHDSPIH